MIGKSEASTIALKCCFPLEMAYCNESTIAEPVPKPKNLQLLPSKLNSGHGYRWYNTSN